MFILTIHHRSQIEDNYTVVEMDAAPQLFATETDLFAAAEKHAAENTNRLLSADGAVRLNFVPHEFARTLCAVALLAPLRSWEDEDDASAFVYLCTDAGQ